MGLGKWISGASRIKVHVLLRGRIGDGWQDIDRVLSVPQGTTLGEFVDIGQRKGIPLRYALEHSPHLRHTLMLNGERCPMVDHQSRTLEDGDEIYLLAPMAGG